MNPFSSINENNRPLGLFEPHKPRFEHDIGFHPNNPFKQSNPTFGPDWTPDFSECINIEAESIGLALSVLGMSKSEYNGITVNQLKELRRIDCDNKNIYSINILTYYKQNSKISISQINPIMESSIEPELNIVMKKNYMLKYIN